MIPAIKTIYMDNGATSFPKAPGVSAAMCHYLENIGTNVSRSTSQASFEAQRVIYETREMLAQLMDFDHPSHVVFTKNVTESLNVLLKGLLRPGDHVIVSPLEHNAVMRPLDTLKRQDVTFSRATCNADGSLIIPSILPLIQPNTKAIVMTHASNVCGTVLDLEAVGKIAKANNLIFIVDAAQTLGIWPVSFKTLSADAIAFTGHKGLLGPQGTGGFAVTPELARQLSPLIEGGTGSLSELEEQPEYMPDKFEAGTPNVVGLFGLHSALVFLRSQGQEALWAIERAHTERFLAGVSELSRELRGSGLSGDSSDLPTSPAHYVKVIGKEDMSQRTAVVSLDFVGQDNADVCWQLEQSFGIITRVGMHCSPAAHRALGTFPQGTVRFSFSPFTTDDDITQAIAAVKALR